MSVILCDANGIVLTRDTGDARLEASLDRVWLAPGFSYAEEHVGTNGIGTALEGGGPARVFGHEHYVEHLEEFACTGVPVRHPVTHKVLGVVDLTCWRRDAGTMMAAAASALGRRIEAMLLEQSGRREHALLHDYLTACRRNRDAVLAVGDDLLMLNDRARELLAPADQGPLLAEIAEALATGRRQQLLVDLPSGLTARVQCKPSFTEGGRSGGVALVQVIGQVSAGSARAVSPPPALPAAVGCGPLWAKCRQSVDRAFRIREWLVLEGEPGTGKTTLARAVHQSRTPAAHLRVLDAAEYGPRWVADVIDELATGGGTLLLTHVDTLPPEAMSVLVDVLEPYRESTDVDGHWVVVTTGKQRGDRDGDLADAAHAVPAHRRGTAAAPPRRGRRRARAAPADPAHPRRQPLGVARGDAGAHAQPVAGQRRAALPGAAHHGGPPPLGDDRAVRPAAGVPGDHPPRAHAAGGDRVRRDRRRAARHRRQQGRGRPPAGHVAGDDLPQDPRVRAHGAARARVSGISRSRGVPGP